MELKTERLRLVPLDPDRDAPTLHVAFSDPDVMRWWNTPSRSRIADTHADLAQSVRADGAHLWVVREGELTAGLVGLLGDVAVPGLAWLLCRRAWGRGLATESAAAVIAYGFESLGLARVEAWVETANLRSLSTARRLGFSERGRLAQRYPHREYPHETIVLGRPRVPESTPVLGIEVTFPVSDVIAQLTLLESVLGARVAYEIGNPPELAGVVFGAWSIGPQLRLVQAATPITPIGASVDVGTEFDACYRRAVQAGADIVAGVLEQPWGVREFAIRTPDGHHLVVTGPG